MDDLVFVAVAIALFAMSALYVRACAYLTGESSSRATNPTVVEHDPR